MTAWYGVQGRYGFGQDLQVMRSIVSPNQKGYDQANDLCSHVKARGRAMEEWLQEESDCL